MKNTFFLLVLLLMASCSTAQYSVSNPKAIKLFKEAQQAPGKSTDPKTHQPNYRAGIVLLDKAIAKDYSELDSFVILVCVEGKITLVHSGATEPTVEISQGEALLIPATIDRVDIIPSSNSKLLEVYIA